MATVNGEIAGHLRALGVAEELVSTYRLVLELEPCELAAVIAGAGHDVAAELDALAELDLVEWSEVGDGTGPLVRAAYPAAALQQLAARRNADITRAHLAALDWVSTHRRPETGGDVSSVVESIRRRDVPEQVSHLEEQARERVSLFDSPPYFRGGTGWPLERRNLARGVAYRVVYATASLDGPDALREQVAPCIRAGEHARATARLPMKLMVIDERLAVVSTAGRNDEQPVLLIKPGHLLDGLIALFEATWRQAATLDAMGHAAGPPVGGDDRRLLTLLAAGASDEQVTRMLGISKRTFFRRLQRLMNDTGARSRFQLALLAQRHDWV